MLLSPSSNELRILVSICESFSEEYMLNFNPDKCKILIYTNSRHKPNIDIMLCHQKVVNVNSEAHLGHIFQTTNPIISIDSIIKDINTRTNVIINKFKPIAWQAKVKLFMSQCASLYGCPLWELDSPKMNDLHTSWRVCCRKLLSLHQQTRSYLLPNVMDTLPVDDIIMKRMLAFYVKGLSHSNEYISSFFKNTLVSNSSYSLTNLNIILN